MSRIAELIAEVAPEGVRSGTLGDIARLIVGKGMPKTTFIDESGSAIHDVGRAELRVSIGAIVADLEGSR